MRKIVFPKKVLLIALLLLISNIFFAQNIKKEESLIIVTGVGQEAVVPDTSIVTLGIQTRNKSVQTSFSENRKTMDKILNSLYRIGIQKKDIKTSNYSTYLENNYVANGVSKQGLYRVTNNITVTVRDISKIGLVVNTAFENGANQMHGITFVSSNSEEAEFKARKESITNAHKKAETLAKEAGVKIVGVHKIIESNSYGGVYLEARKMSSSQSNVISAGTETISVNTEVQYIIEKQ